MLFSFDEVTGFPETIEAVYPYAEIQRYIVHQICDSARYISCNDLKAFAVGLKLGCLESGNGRNSPFDVG